MILVDRLTFGIAVFIVILAMLRWSAEHFFDNRNGWAVTYLLIAGLWVDDLYYAITAQGF